MVELAQYEENCGLESAARLGLGMEGDTEQALETIQVHVRGGALASELVVHNDKVRDEDGHGGQLVVEQVASSLGATGLGLHALGVDDDERTRVASVVATGRA